MTAHAELARSPRFVRIAQVLRDEFGRLYGIATEQVDPHESFLALGADSLMLLRASRFVRDQFGVRVPFRDLLDGLGTVHALAAHVHGQLPVEEQAPSADAPPSAPSAAVSAPKSSHIPSISADARLAIPSAQPMLGGGVVERIVAQQLRVMQEQLDGLGVARSVAAPTISADVVDASASAESPQVAAVRKPDAPQTKETAATSPSHDGGSEDGERPLTAEQAAHVAALSERLATMTAGSRNAVEAARNAVADPQSAVGFRAAWKHLCYPLAVAHASGGRFTDVDGNEFVDLEMRGGDLVLGHASGIAIDAMRAALDAPSPRAATDAAALIREMAGVERVAFFASRGDATAAALRIARTATERDLVAVFAGADHGAVDGLMGRGTPLRDGRAVPAVAGVPAGMVGALLVLEGEDALETLRARGFDVAAVVVDAAHLSCGEMEAGDFLRTLERICLDTGAALVLDESATMPRVHPGGLARMHCIEADLIVLGRAIGNGAPIAAVAGKASYMDTVDGGPWSLLDGSEPRIETTRIRGDEPHALGIAAAGAVLGYVREHGTATSAEMSRLAEWLASAIRVALGDDAPLTVDVAGSRITLAPREGAEADADLLRLHLRSRRVHLPVSGVCHLSSAHTDADVDRVASAVEHAVREMRAAGFLAGGASPDAASTGAASRESASSEFASPESAANASTESASSLFAPVRSVIAAEMAGRPEDQSDAVELPLTAGQREMWLLAQISAEAARAYHEPTALRIRGPFSVDAMTAALRELVARHEALRTRFGALGQTQHVEPSVSLDVPVNDLSALPHHEAEAELAAALANEAAQPFDLAAAPLFRARIVRMGEADHVLAYTLHHAVTDGWSNGTLLGELQDIYAARLEVRAHALPAPHRYRDAVRLRAAASESAALAFWRERLAAPLPTPELPLDRARPAAQTFAGALERHEMDAGLRARLDALCEARGTTFYGLLLAAFQLFLHRITGQDDVLVGTIAAGQAWDEDAAAVGYFVDLLPLRSTLAGDPGFGDFADAANAGLFDALEHRGVPLSRLVEAMEIPRDPSRPPLLAAVLNWHRAAGAGLRFGHADAERLEAHGGTSKFELTVTAVESAAGTWLDWEYNTDLFDAATIRRWMGHFETLLAAAAADPARPVRELPLLSAPELHRVLEEWNAAAPGDSADECLHTPFERQAAATLHAVALETADERVTYAELDARADRVGHALRRLGVGPDTVVGLCAERSVAMVVGMMGILKAGGAYLPLDPSLPADRLAYMVENARPAAVLAQAGSVDALPSIDRPVLLIEDAEREDSGDAGRCDGGAGPANLAYVIYTSGSTGRPKGVMVPHRGIRNRVAWVRDTYPMDAGDAVLFKTPYTFDASVWELFLPLWTAGRVVIARPGGHQDPAYMVDAMARHGVTTLQLVPSMLQVLAGTPGLERCTALRRLSCGGEAYPVALAREVSARLPGVTLVNLYGPTEASIDVLSWRYSGDEMGTLLPIGRPVHGTRIYLLDADLRPVAPGAPGELYADGPGLARGYVGRPDLTAERFIPDPHSPVPGARMYRTGDLARHRPDGAVEFLGRADDQVKLRGFRIELGEVESVLSAHPSVEAAVAAVRPAAAGPALVAYVVGAGDEKPDAAELREHARRHLPDYMVPSAVVVLDALPRTPGGKVDRLSLPTPRAADFAARDGYVPPRCATEQVLADVWAEVLKTGAVGVHDRFFDLGGHSLSALQLLARVRSVLGVEVPLRALFDAPTVAGLAAAVERLRGEAVDAEMPPLVRYPAEAEGPLSFAQQRLWLLHQLEPESPAYNLYTSIPLPPRADTAAVEASLASLVARHEALRTTLPEGDGSGIQHVHPAAPIPLTVLDFTVDTDRVAELADDPKPQPGEDAHPTLSRLRGRVASLSELGGGASADRDTPTAAHLPSPEKWEQARTAMRHEVMRPFDLASGPVLRATLVRIDPSADHLVLVMHHAVSDGWSLDVIRDEVTALYAAAAEGRPSPLPELPVQYGDYARWERDWLRGDALERHLSFWRERLAGMPQVIELPADRPRPAAQSYRGGNAMVRLPADLADALRALGRDTSSTLFMTLLAAWKTVLHRWGAGDDLVVGTHVANRDRVEVERLVGFFVNSLVLRTDLGGDPTFRQVVERVRETALGAFGHAHLPFDRLVEELQPRRDMGIPPLYQVSFDLQRAAGSSDVEAPRLLEESPTTKFDLEVTALEMDAEVQVHVAYATDLFDATTVERMLGHLHALLAAAVTDPDRRISALPLLGEGERETVTRDFQGPRRAYRTDRTLDQLFAEQAARTPHEIAAVCDGVTATYAEMDARSNRLAHLLRGLGVGRGQRVGIMTERGIGFVAAILGVLKAGAAYVPIDPGYPDHRLRHMLADSRIAVLVTRAGIAAASAQSVAASPDLRAVICLDDIISAGVEMPGISGDARASFTAGDAVKSAVSGDAGTPADSGDARRAMDSLAAAAPSLRIVEGAEVDAQPADALADDRAAHPRDPAYVLYTSGSTGLPKGAVVRHDGAVNHVFAECEVLGLGAELRFLQSAPASSDISVWQMLAPLLVGGRTVIVDADTVSEPERLLAVLRGEGVTLFEPVPAVLRALLDHASTLPAEDAALPALRCVMATGEEVPADLVNGWLRAYPDSVVVNAYGPTEASDDVTQLAICEPLADDARGVSIGRPLPNLDCHVVDESMALVPLGVPGELCIGGIAVGDGYLGQPARTAASFVPDPFGAPGSILYRTGDRVRWTADGTLEFLGRTDRQVKVRGFRIEPGEVEAALRAHAAVRDCAVVVRAEGTERTLAAYLVADADALPDAAALRDHLRERVPEHMVPGLFVRLDALPHTPAGKVDRRALADDRREGMAPAAAHVAPRTSTEEALAAIWGEVLGRQAVSVDADFFDLGGHSLLAAMVAARIRAGMGVTLPLRRVFEHTTVARLAAHVDEVRGQAPKPSGPTLGRVARTQRRVGTVDDGILKSL